MKRRVKNILLPCMIMMFICTSFLTLTLPTTVQAASNEEICAKRYNKEEKSEAYELCVKDLNNRDEQLNQMGISNIRICGVSLDARVPNFTSGIYTLLLYATPIIMILFGMLDFAKATVSQDAGDMKKAGSKFIKRLISGAAVFLVLVIVQFACALLQKSGAGSGFDCANCLINGDCK
ncbi:MAG: hypothetical protein KH135_04075 [Firmicutes bacterium]|nr:hypothetical protein [Bacillota bacterium]